MRPDELDDFRCGQCGYKLKFDEETEEDLVQWLMTHCSQEDSEPAQTEKEYSGVPSDNDS